MKLNLKKLHLELRKSTEVLEFPSLSYFYGPIGSGKSSIARLIDYCLGANVEWPWALQQEFVSAALELQLNDRPLTLHRTRESSLVVAVWQEGEDVLQVAVPARTAGGEVLPGTGVEVLSDLIFYLAEVEPPKVRRKKGSPDEHLERLSFRDLYRFCYLDQDGMDNSFFKLNSDNYAVQRKSVDTLRYLLGYHQEQLAELEARLQKLREERMARQAGAEALAKALSDAGFDDALGIDLRIEETKAAIDAARRDAARAREARGPAPHAVDALRNKARSLAQELAANEDAVAELNERIEDLVRHENELQMLSVRFQRTATARSIIGGVDFKSCPRCTHTLPQREPDICPVCGQTEHVIDSDNALNEDVVKADLRARQGELRDTIARMRAQRKRLSLRAAELREEKAQTEWALAAQMRDYDSAFMSQAIEHERIITTLEQKLNALIHNRKLPDVLEEQRELAARLQGDESETRVKLEAARKLAFKDTKNIEKLGELFLDCLLRVKFPDVKPSFHVQIDPSSFDPQITFSEDGEFIVLSFANAGSGGMKSLFKTCYALAVHRLCTSLGSALPNLLIIDTATKNVSSKENPEVVTSFYEFVYELATTELRQTQIVIIDNEFTAPPDGMEVVVKARHMANGSEEHPPLIPYLVSSLAETGAETTSVADEEGATDGDDDISDLL